jgi:hypothetical protein
MNYVNLHVVKGRDADKLCNLSSRVIMQNNYPPIVDVCIIIVDNRIVIVDRKTRKLGGLSYDFMLLCGPRDSYFSIAFTGS